jgi:hypothetical protein
LNFRCVVSPGRQRTARDHGANEARSGESEILAPIVHRGSGNRLGYVLMGHECENSRSRHTFAVDNVVVCGMQRPGKSSRDEHGGKWMPDRRDEILYRDEKDLQRLIGKCYQGTYRANPRRTDHQHPLRYQSQRSVSRIRPRLSAAQPHHQRPHIPALQRLLFVTGCPVGPLGAGSGQSVVMVGSRMARQASH